MTAGQLRQGFEKMPRPCPAAILFGLDTNMTVEQVMTLNWKEANRLRGQGKLSEFACHILDSQPIHIASNYVFWVIMNKKPMPLFGLDGLIFENFGLLWSELQSSCENLIWVDEEIDALDFLANLEAVSKAVLLVSD
ncbi:MAG: hypothetical protein NTY03_05145 [Candidatus Bathyarchaeota archaeon]|nr:hypothetical protein [Candidatus Bathyarchaeota archaeon]